ncbi:MarR family transcriptional regulator [Longispora sp. NPDC051575]|uniref:MarR family winged helix-turn-helix transcriptional regulator n=1 Tax=Longispora sp. NPDC051575 TaxID=3154943 RepID=UPI0034206E86
MADRLHDALDRAMVQLFRLRGVLDSSQAAAGLGMSVSEAMALRYLANGPSTQQELGSYLALEKSTVSRLVDAMVSKGWVGKERDPDNRRYLMVTLTEAGIAAAASVAEAMRQRHSGMLEALSGEELQALAVALPALVRVLSDDPGSPQTRD